MSNNETSKLEKLKISEKNRIKNIIKDNLYSIKLSENNIDNIKKSDIKDSDFIQKTLKKSYDNIESKTKENEELESRIFDIERGLLNQEFIQNKKDNDEKNKIDLENKKKRDLKKLILLEENKVTNDEVYTKSINKYQSNDRYNEKVMDNDLKYYMKTCNSIPEYIKQNLKTMPNNKGYIFKNVWCYGELPIPNDRDKNNLTMFEKNVSTNTLLIHIYTPTEYILYEKKGNKNKELVKREMKKSKNFKK